METKDQEEVVVDTLEDTNEEVTETTEETEQTPEVKSEKPKRTPQEELEYFEGRAARLRKKLGVEETQNSKPEVKTASDKPSDLDYGQKAFLKTYGIAGSDELALVKAFQSRTGDDLDTIVSDDIFLGKLNALRSARETAQAIPKGKGRSAQTAVTNIDIAVAKFKETGELPADFEARRQVIDKAVVEPSKSNNALFAGK